MDGFVVQLADGSDKLAEELWGVHGDLFHGSLDECLEGLGGEGWVIYFHALLIVMFEAEVGCVPGGCECRRQK